MRRGNSSNEVNFTPLPPGSIFIGNKSFGSWKKKGTTTKVWKFFRVYRQIPKYLGWEDFTPTLKFHKELLKREKQSLPFIGSNDEFGLGGSITQIAFPKYFKRQKPNSVDFNLLLQKYINENYIK